MKDVNRILVVSRSKNERTTNMLNKAKTLIGGVWQEQASLL